MMYERTWRIQSAHLNSIAAYKTLWAIAEHPTQEMPSRILCEDVLNAMRDCHGHNFKINVWVSGELRDNRPWLVDDPKLEAVIRQFDNTNLSLLPFFLANKRRATTEELAMLLWSNLHVVAMEDDCSVVRVEVWENDDICASYEPPLHALAKE